MVDALKIGLSALLTQQRAIAVTSNNIANAGTPGYSRQRSELSELGVERLGSNYFGTGVQIDSVRRYTDSFLMSQLQSAASALGRSAVFGELAGTLDSLLADERTGLNVTLQRFFNAIQEVADDPASASARRALISEAETLVSRFDTITNRLEALNTDVAARITASATEINGIGQSLANLNGAIVASGGASPDLLDQRDRLLSRLAELVEFSRPTEERSTRKTAIGSAA